MARNIASKNNGKYFTLIQQPDAVDTKAKKYKKTENYREFFF